MRYLHTTVTRARRLHFDYADYLAALEQSALKLEYCDGVIYAMAGGTRAHAELAAATIVALHAALPRSCRVATSDLKVRVEATDLSAFPDASVVCGPARTSSIDANALVNPTVLVEVTSRSTEDYDRGDKASHYTQLESLQAILFVSHKTRRITIVERTSDGGTARWVERDVRGGESVTLPVHGAAFAVDAVYEGIELDPA
jgi:Uma2 family endonuclease